MLYIIAQTADPIVATIGDTPIYKSEFEYAYNKSRQNNLPEQFLQSYINLKLKVEEARKKEIDKYPDFEKEYNKYLDILMNTYLKDTVSLSSYAKKIYDRRLENIAIEEIFVPYTNFPVYPKDTLEAYNKMKKIVSELDSDGSNFSQIANKYKPQQQEGVPQTDTKKWITSFTVDPAFEDQIYNTDINGITKPVRTNFGYHLAKVLDRHDDRGDVNVSHILFVYPAANATQAQRDSVMEVANKVYKQLLSGGDFEELCKQYSSDKSTSSDGGNLGWYGVVNPLPEQFNIELSKIQPSQTTSLIETSMGYHIFKLNEKKNLAPWSKAKVETMEYILESPRKNKVRALELEKISEEVPYTLNGMAYSYLVQLSNADFPDSPSFAEKTKPFMNETLVTCGASSYTVADFVDYINKNSYRLSSTSVDVLSDYLNEFILTKALIEKRSKLYVLYPDLKNISQEYFDGLMAFEIMNDEVWNKSVKNKQGLQKTFEQNSNRYKWNNPKFDGYLVHVKNKEVLDEVRQFIKENKNSSSNMLVLLKDRFNKNENQIVIEKGLWGKGENDFVDNILYGTVVKKEKVGFPVFLIEGESVSQPRTYEDVRGQVVADYQSILEAEWIDALRKKYKVSIDEDVLNTIE